MLSCCKYNSSEKTDLNSFLGSPDHPDIKPLLGISQLAVRVCCCLFHSPSNPGKGEMAKHLDESHLCLEHCKSHPNASSRTLTKAQKGVRTPAGLSFLAEVIWVEHRGIGIIFWVA